MVYFNYNLLNIVLVVVFLPKVSSFFITPSSDVKTIMSLSSESPIQNDSKENDDKVVDVLNVRRLISGESKDFKDYEEYFERGSDVYPDDSNKTSEIDESSSNSTPSTFPLPAHIFIDKMLPIFDGSKDKKKIFREDESSNDGTRKVDINTSNIF